MSRATTSTDLVTVGTAMGTLAQQMGVRSAAPASVAASARDMREEVGRALERLYVGINELYRGNARVLTELWSRGPEVTAAGPTGDIRAGWEQVRADLHMEGQMRNGWQLGLDDVTIGFGADVAWATCAERGTGVTDDGRPIEFRQRSTNILRLEAGVWKLVHRQVEIIA